MIHNFFFLGEFSLYYDPNVHTPSSWLGPLVILSPIVGGLVVIFLTRLPPADRRGQGVSDIIDAIYYREGRVRSLRRSSNLWPPASRAARAARSAVRRRSCKSAPPSPRARRASPISLNGNG